MPLRDLIKGFFLKTFIAKADLISATKGVKETDKRDKKNSIVYLRNTASNASRTVLLNILASLTLKRKRNSETEDGRTYEGDC